jgi:hypothetical protein
MGVDQWATRVTGVDGGIGLDELARLAGIVGVRVGTVQGTDNAASDGEAESNRLYKYADCGDFS